MVLVCFSYLTFSISGEFLFCKKKESKADPAEKFLLTKQPPLSQTVQFFEYKDLANDKTTLHV